MGAGGFRRTVRLGIRVQVDLGQGDANVPNQSQESKPLGGLIIQNAAQLAEDGFASSSYTSGGA